ncbi:MAG: butyryl-CoA dehydrogenase [Planctomycetota bacterium]|jgi:butyryl-CoA dehydrogenase
MDFELDEELVMVRDMARDFADNELIPRATKHDRESKIDPDVFKMLGELGLWGLTVPEEYGGAGMGNLALAVVLEELNRGCASTGVTVSVHNSLLGAPIKRFGTAEQKQAFLPALASGETLGAYCLTEAGAGSDAGALRTSAEDKGDHFLVNGEKLFVTNADFAGLFLIYVRTGKTEDKAHGISALLVPGDTEGLKIATKEKKCGIRGSATSSVELTNVIVPKENMLGELNSGFKVAMDTLDGGRIGIAAQAVGIGRACLEASVKYSKEREQFGREIGRFQAIQWKLADMSTRLDASRLLVHRAAATRDSGKPCTPEAAKAKLFASITSNFCADECLQIHGGAGYTDDFHVERLFRDARITEIYEGATDIQRLIIARDLLA